MCYQDSFYIFCRNDKKNDLHKGEKKQFWVYFSIIFNRYINFVMFQLQHLKGTVKVTSLYQFVYKYLEN